MRDSHSRQATSGWPRAATLILLALLTLASVPGLAAIKDAEQASHDDSAARVQVVDTYEYSGFQVVQFNLAVLSHYSYLLVSDGKALAIDPARDVEAYLELLRQKGWTLEGVFLTHSHADFVAGHMELARSANCPIYANRASQALFPHQPLGEGSTLQVGQASVSILETPGHTPDGLCAAVYSPGEPKSPKLLFTGDTLFVGSVGRPDLMGGTLAASSLASMLFDTWTKKLAPLDDSVAVYPAHGAGSLCGAHLRDDPRSTVGTERRTNPYLQHRTRSEFVAAVLDGLPDAPQYFKHNAKLNHDGPPLVDRTAPLPGDSTAALAMPLPTGTVVIDLRDAKPYAAGHVPGSLNIGLRGRLETWTGIMVPWGTEVHLLGSEAELTEAVGRLHRVGYAVAGTLRWEAWQAAGKPIATTEVLEPRKLHESVQKGEGPLIVDVRLPAEWMAVRIGQIVNLPLDKLAALAPVKLDRNEPIVAVCNSAFRSSLAVGVLERLGFRKAMSLAGGTEAWVEAGLPVQSAPAQASVASPAPIPVRWPARIEAADLRRQLQDLPGSFELVDLRPAALFADYSLPGARNVDPGALLADPAVLAAKLPLILVDRDGTLAMAVAGMLMPKTERQVSVLYGGLTSYWKEGLSSPAAAVPALQPGAAAPAAPPLAAPSAPQAPVAPQAPPAPARRKSAGC